MVLAASPPQLLAWPWASHLTFLALRVPLSTIRLGTWNKVKDTQLPTVRRLTQFCRSQNQKSKHRREKRCVGRIHAEHQSKQLACLWEFKKKKKNVVWKTNHFSWTLESWCQGGQWVQVLKRGTGGAREPAGAPVHLHFCNALHVWPSHCSYAPSLNPNSKQQNRCLVTVEEWQGTD